MPCGGCSALSAGLVALPWERTCGRRSSARRSREDPETLSRAHSPGLDFRLAPGAESWQLGSPGPLSSFRRGDLHDPHPPRRQAGLRLEELVATSNFSLGPTWGERQWNPASVVSELIWFRFSSRHGEIATPAPRREKPALLSTSGET